MIALPTSGARTLTYRSSRRGSRRTAVIGLLVVLLVLSSVGLGRTEVAPLASETPLPAASDARAGPTPTPTSTAIGPSSGGTGSSAVSLAFDQRVAQAASALKEAGVPVRDVRLPYVGPSAQIVDGVVVPGYAASPSNVTPGYGLAPAPSGVAYYGENDTSGKIEGTTVDASSVVGTLTVNELRALYLDDDTPDMWGIQLNAVLTNVRLQGQGAYQFWVQNAVDYFQHNDTLNLGEDSWNFSSPTATFPLNNSTILRHSPNSTLVTDTYVGQGPWIPAPLPFTLTLYLNSSLTSEDDQEVWFNYSLVAAGGVHAHGNYDWLVFNSTNPGHNATVPLAAFQATGTHLNPVGLPNDFELDFGIGPYDGSTLDVLAANASATLDYCPITTASCTTGELQSVPAAENFGGDTGETSTGLSVSYVGTTAEGTGGPFILRGLWGFAAAVGSSPGATPVANAITVAGSPEPLLATPYVFVFFNGSTIFRPAYEWAPDVPVWYLPEGTYRYEVMLADYAEENGTIVVGPSPTELSLTLRYHPASGVYTPLWAFSDAQLGGISATGDGSISRPYRLFNNPTVGCTECGNARDQNLSPFFFSLNDFQFPTFTGIWLVDTDAYVLIDRPVSFCVFGFSWGHSTNPNPGPYFYLQIGLVATHHVTLTNDTELGGWPAMSEISTLGGTVEPAENPFPQANVMIWNSTDDLVMSSTFVPAWVVPQPVSPCPGVCPAVTCYGCVPPDGLLLYGGRNNTVWGNTFRDPVAPSVAPHFGYAGLAIAESGDLVFNNNFSVDNPAVLLPFDIYNNSCPDGFAGDCAPPIPPTYHDTWNVTAQPASDVAATVNGFVLSGSILGPNCPTQGGNYWQDYGNSLNPYGVLPFTNVFDYFELRMVVPSWSSTVQKSIVLGGDSAPLVRSGSCGIPTPATSLGLLNLVYAIVGGVVAGGLVAATVVVLRPLWRTRPAPWLEPARGGAGTEAAVARIRAWVPALPAPSLRERLARRPLGIGLWAGLSLLAVYLAAALSALVVYRSSLYAVPINQSWISPYNPIGPSLAHPFGVLTGLGTDLFRAVWQATPWDLAIVAGILGLDAGLGWVLGSLAGMYEGGTLDSAVMFLGDALGAIPSFFLVVVLFAGLATVAPSSVSLPLFVLLFGIVIWPTTARTTRERARSVSREPFLESARASGGGRFYLFFRHVLPNSLSPVLAQLPIDVAPIFFVLTIFPWFWDCAGPGGSKGVYFLIPSLPPYSPLPAVNFPEWGNLLAIGACEGLPISTVGNTYWWMLLFPLLAILLLGIAIALVCDGIEKRLNARRP